MEIINILEFFEHLPFPGVIYKTVDGGDDFTFYRVNKESRELDSIDSGVLGLSLRKSFPGVEEFGLLEVLRKTLKTGIKGHLPTNLYHDDKLRGYRENWVIKIDDETLLVIYFDRDDYMQIIDSLDTQRSIAIECANLASVGEMSASISHEIKNPLTIISGKLQQLKRKVPDLSVDEIQQQLERVQKEVERINNITNSVLNLSKGFNESNRERTKLCDLLEKTFPYINSLEGIEEIGIDVTNTTGSDFSFKCVPIQIQQVLINFIKNSVEALKEVDKPQIILGFSLEEEDLVITLTHNGPELSEDLLTKIGTRLFSTKGKSGTGLGVYLSKKIIEDHSGELIIMNFKGHPLFKISLPAS